MSTLTYNLLIIIVVLLCALVYNKYWKINPSPSPQEKQLISYLKSNVINNPLTTLDYNDYNNIGPSYVKFPVETFKFLDPNFVLDPSLGVSYYMCLLESLKNVNKYIYTLVMMKIYNMGYLGDISFISDNKFQMSNGIYGLTKVITECPNYNISSQEPPSSENCPFMKDYDFKSTKMWEVDFNFVKLALNTICDIIINTMGTPEQIERYKKFLESCPVYLNPTFKLFQGKFSYIYTSGNNKNTNYMIIYKKDRKIRVATSGDNKFLTTFDIVNETMPGTTSQNRPFNISTGVIVGDSLQLSGLILKNKLVNGQVVPGYISPNVGDIVPV